MSEVRTNLTPVEAFALVARGSFVKISYENGHRYSYLDAGDDAQFAQVDEYAILLDGNQVEICHNLDVYGGQAFSLVFAP